MKKLTLLALLFAAVTITGCKKDNTVDINSANIIGKWYIKQIVETEYEGGVQVGKDTETNFTTEDYVEFKSNGRMLEKDHSGYSDERNYSVASGKLTLSEIGDPTDKQEFEVKQLTATKLVLYSDETEVYQGVTYRDVIEITFQK